jgi:alkaline phosphatase
MKKTNLFLGLIAALILMSASALAEKKPRNVIVMIGDGMGLAQMYTAMTANNNQLQLERCTFTGLSKTYSSDHYTTDSGAGGTAIACGVKTKNGMIGMTPDSVKTESILELSERNQLSTGIVVTCAVTHATPASFIAHQVNRDMYEEIATDFLKTDIDVFIGGGLKYFNNRKDHVNLVEKLKSNNYQIAYSLDEAVKVKSGKLAGLFYEDHCPPMPKRGDMLPKSVMTAIDILDNNKKGFFLMVEGSQIDWAAHDNDKKQIVKEMLDFDQTIGKVLDYAQKDGNTLVIITADHETGGMTILNGKFGSDEMDAYFSTKNHSGVPVPIYAFGPGAEQFTGIMENTAFKGKIEKLLDLKK